MSKRTTASPAARYFRLVRKSLAGIRRDMPALAEMGEAMARPILAGGDLAPAGVARFWPSEFSGRAGGLMGIRARRWRPSRGKDVALFALPDPRKWDPAADETLGRLMKSRGQLFVIGRREDLSGLGSTDRFAAFTGGADPNAGLYGLDAFRPLAGLREFEQIVRGWIVTGEFITACIRAGKMPIIWMSVWMEGAMVRNASFIKQDNLREPWWAPMFHEDRHIPPLAPTYAAEQFVGFVESLLTGLEGQLDRLATAGKWLAEAHAAGRRIWTIAVGHSYPMILDLPEKGYPLQWGHSVSDLRRAVSSDLKRGDVAFHLGYSPVDVGDVGRIVRREVRFIYTSPFGRPAALNDHRNLLWFDLPWRPGDACVDVPGYSARIIPSSSSAQTMAYFAILSEMAEQMGWR